MVHGKSLLVMSASSIGPVAKLDRGRRSPATCLATDLVVGSRNLIIVGGGIVGLATAYKLGRRLPQTRVTLLEKEDSVGRHQSSNNSGVLHCGLYYKPGSTKARLAVTGIEEMVAFCRAHDVAHEVCGKLVVATDASELERLHALHERGRQNGLQGLAFLTADQMREIEPHVG